MKHLCTEVTCKICFLSEKSEDLKISGFDRQQLLSMVVNKDVEQLKTSKGIKWWQEGRLPKVISGSETGKAQKAIPGVVGFEQISVEPIQKLHLGQKML